MVGGAVVSAPGSDFEGPEIDSRLVQRWKCSLTAYLKKKTVNLLHHMHQEHLQQLPTPDDLNRLGPVVPYDPRKATVLKRRRSPGGRPSLPSLGVFPYAVYAVAPYY